MQQVDDIVIAIFSAVRDISLLLQNIATCSFLMLMFFFKFTVRKYSTVD